MIEFADEVQLWAGFVLIATNALPRNWVSIGPVGGILVINYNHQIAILPNVLEEFQ